MPNSGETHPACQGRRTVLIPSNLVDSSIRDTVKGFHPVELHLYGTRIDNVLAVVKAIPLHHVEDEDGDDSHGATFLNDRLRRIGFLSSAAIPNHAHPPAVDWLYLSLDHSKPYTATVGTQPATLLVYNPCRLPRPSPSSNKPDTSLESHFPPAPRSSSSDPLTAALDFLIHYQSARFPTSAGSVAPRAPSLFLNPSPSPSLSPPPMYFFRQYLTSTRIWLAHVHANPTMLASLSGLWLAINDRIMGLALAVWILDPATRAIVQSTARLVVNVLYEVAFHYPTRSLAWFMSYPAGLKLNGPLARFVAELGQWIVAAWTSGPVALVADVLVHPGLSTLTAAVAIAGGFSLVAGVLVGDVLLGVCMAHLEVMHGATHKLMRAQARGLLALVQVFVGKQWNPLRRRTETAEFSGEQLLMGTLVFTMLIFLAPTTGVFWLYFESVHITVGLVRMFVGSVLWFLHTFPLFLLAIRFKEPSRLPGPLRIEPIDGARAYRILNEPVGWWDIISPKQQVLVLPRRRFQL